MAGGSTGTADAGRARAKGAAPAARPGGATDAAGVLVLSCCAIWTLVSAAGRAARPEGTLLALLAVTAGFAAGRILGALVPVLAPAAAAVTVLGLVLVPSSRLSAHGAAPPLGRHDADAALLVLAAGAACCAAVAARGRLVRAVLRLLGAGATGTALALGSPAAFGAGVAVLLCSLVAPRSRRRTLPLVALALTAMLVVGGSYAVAADALPAGLSQPLTGRLSHPRVQLWHEAAALAEHHPLRGVGPDRFSEETSLLSGPSVTADSPQSTPLQLAAEQGVPGAALLGAAYGWMLCALWRSPRPTAVVVTAAAALTALAFLATVDHVLGSVVVTSAAGLLAGIATARPLAGDDDEDADAEGEPGTGSA